MQARSALLDRNLGGFDCVFLCNVAQFTADEARAMDNYLRGGGSLVFFLGDSVLADRYQRELGVVGEEGTARRESGTVPIGPGTVPNFAPAKMGLSPSPRTSARNQPSPPAPLPLAGEGERKRDSPFAGEDR